MSALNKGLPQPALSYGLPIGGITYLPDFGATISAADGSLLLRSGTLLPKSSAPTLAQLRQFQVCGKLRTGTNMPVNVRQIATNGAGVYVATNAASGTVYRSTDGGDTWTAITSGLSSITTIAGVAYGAGRFVVAGVTATPSAAMAYSTDNGVTWTVGSAVTATGNFVSFANNASALVQYTGNRFIALFNTSGGVAGLNVMTSTDGSALLAVYNSALGLPTNIDPNQLALSLQTDGAGRIVACGLSSGWNAYNYSSDHGVTWSAVNATSSGYIFSGALKGGVFIFTTSDVPLLYSVHPNASTATGRVRLNGCQYGSVSIRSADGTTSTDAFLTSSLGWTAKLSADGLTSTPWQSTLYNPATLLPTGSDFMQNNGSQVYSYDAKLATSDYVGLPVVLSSGNSIAYVRAK